MCQSRRGLPWRQNTSNDISSYLMHNQCLPRRPRNPSPNAPPTSPSDRLPLLRSFQQHLQPFHPTSLPSLGDETHFLIVLSQLLRRPISRRCVLENEGRGFGGFSCAPPAIPVGKEMGERRASVTSPEREAQVVVNVYDLTPANSYTAWCGLGIFHSGIEGWLSKNLGSCSAYPFPWISFCSGRLGGAAFSNLSHLGVGLPWPFCVYPDVAWAWLLLKIGKGLECLLLRCWVEDRCLLFDVVRC